MSTTKKKWPEDLLEFKDDGRDWARRILAKQNAGEIFSITVTDMAKRALGLPIGESE